VNAIGQPITDDDFLLYSNGGSEPVDAVLPGPEFRRRVGRGDRHRGR
jgi:hypothetical protein